MEKTDFHNKLREIREEKGVSLVELAYMSGVGYTHLSRLQKMNPAKFMYSTVYQLSEALKVPIRMLFPPKR